MSDFLIFKEAVREQFSKMEQHGLFVTDVEKDDLWDTYLGSFKPEDNPMFRKRTEHDCSCCRQFIKACGNVVAIIDGEMTSIWDVNVDGTGYQIVADAMSELVKSKKIKSKFLYFQATLGTDHNLEQIESGEVIEWNHFHHVLDGKYTCIKRNLDTEIGKHKTSVQTFKRALEEITIDAISTALDLIVQN